MRTEMQLKHPPSHTKPWAVIAEVETDQIFSFPCGMVGFPDAKQYVFLRAGKGGAVCMQCVDHPEAAFILTSWDEARLGPPPALKPEERQLLALAEGEAPMWLLVLNPFADREWVFANLRAPVALNIRALLGMQCVQADPELPLRYRWMRQPHVASNV